MLAKSLMRTLWLAAAIMVAALLLSCSQSATDANGVDDDNEDTIPPSAVSDLAVMGFTDHSVSLGWTAPGDDSTAGTATAYDIRYSAIDNLWSGWDSADSIEGVPVPLEAGTAQSMTVSGLMTDSTYYFALRAYDDSDNSSFISNVASATCLNDYVVEFPDQGLEEAVREAISKSTGEIKKSDLLPLTSLVAEDAGIVSLSGLQHCTNLQWLVLRANSISDIAPLAGLGKLTSLDLTGNQVADITHLQNITSLTQLTLGDNLIGDIGAVAGMENLEVLQLGSNQVVDIGALEGLGALTYLTLAQNEVRDISALVNNAGLGSETTVVLGGNPLSLQAVTEHIPALLARGVTVSWDVDTTPPASIADLRVVGASASSLELAWTAPGDDGIFGTAYSYEVRYGTDSASVAGWTGALTAPAPPDPGQAGATDSMTVGGLEPDSTYYFAIRTRDESDNWSETSNTAAGTPFVDFVVPFADINLEASVRAALGIPAGDIYRTDLFGLRSLEAAGQGIGDLAGLEYCVNMDTLNLGNNSISEIGPLATLTGLTMLDLTGNSVSALGALTHLGNLRWLGLDDNSVSDLAPIAGLTHLYYLYIRENQISSLGPLAGITGLAAGDQIWLGTNPLSTQSLDVYIPALEARGVTVHR